jgi:capsular exopolysaccharide synthesis family protein
VLVTSGVEREGKTTTAVNLAAALAMSGKQVVLVGADLRRPHLHDVFDGDNSIGLTSVLANGIDVDVALQSPKIDGLRLLAAGPLAADPGALLESSDLASVLDQLRELADFVVLDSAPLLTVADTVPLMELADMTLLVVDARRSTHRRVSSAVAAMAQARGKLVAAVLTKANSRATELPLYASENYRGSRRRVVSLRAKAGG